MLRKFLLGIMVVSMASLVWAGVPDPINCDVDYLAGSGSLMHIRPDGGLGSATRFDAMYGPSGGAPNVDGTITLTLRDENSVPVFDYPWEDMWLECAGVVFCAEIPSRPNGGSTDTNGQTYWNAFLFGGGFGDGIDVVVGGSVLDTVPYRINSADQTGNLFVDSFDVGPFFAKWGASYNFGADFNNDGQVNSFDVAPFFGAWQADCPIP